MARHTKLGGYAQIVIMNIAKLLKLERVQENVAVVNVMEELN